MSQAQNIASNLKHKIQLHAYYFHLGAWYTNFKPQHLCPPHYEIQSKAQSRTLLFLINCFTVYLVAPTQSSLPMIPPILSSFFLPWTHLEILGSPPHHSCLSSIASHMHSCHTHQPLNLLFLLSYLPTSNPLHINRVLDTV